MSDKERLIEIIQKSVGGCARAWALAVANGLERHGAIVPPCKVGDTVYYPTHFKSGIIEGKVSRIIITEKEVMCETEYKKIKESDFGKTVFFNREEAERELAYPPYLDRPKRGAGE